MFTKIFNMGLRMGSLGTKMLLTLYMGRYLTLADMGTYGLVTAYVAVAMAILGLRLTYIASRDIVEATPTRIVSVVRDQLVFYGLNYLLAFVVLLILVVGPLHQLDTKIVIYTFILSVLESLAATTGDNLVALKKPTSANILFFLRASLWPYPAMLLGLFIPAFRDIHVILLAWLTGLLLSLIMTGYVWSYLPWRQGLKSKIDWIWMKRGAVQCFPIWLGAVGLSASLYADRFVLESGLGRSFVGIASFYGSFSGSVQAILQSGVYSFSYPHLITYHQGGDQEKFWHEVRKMTLEACMTSIFLSLAIACFMPFLSHLLHRPELSEYGSTLGLLLIAICVRSASESLHYVLYAWHQDRLIWMGNALTLIPAFGSNLLLLPIFGFSAIGYSAILTALLMGLWRWGCFRFLLQHKQSAVG